MKSRQRKTILIMFLFSNDTLWNKLGRCESPPRDRLFLCRPEVATRNGRGDRWSLSPRRPGKGKREIRVEDEVDGPRKVQPEWREHDSPSRAMAPHLVPWLPVSCLDSSGFSEENLLWIRVGTLMLGRIAWGGHYTVEVQVCIQVAHAAAFGYDTRAGFKMRPTTDAGPLKAL